MRAKRVAQTHFFNMTLFKERVISVVQNIPKGETLSYGEVAKRAGSPGAARAVGMIMKQNKDGSVPCHRVIRSDGKVGGYNGLKGKKRELLQKEGVTI